MPNTTGSCVKVWAQDPSVNGLDAKTRTLYFPENIARGPKNSDIEITGVSFELAADSNGDYLFNPNHSDPYQGRYPFAVMHTFAIVDQVLNLYRRALTVLGTNEELVWQWGNTPIQVVPYAGVEKNAYYSRQERALKFFYFIDPNGQPVYTCESTDIVAHETGHAILDALQPGYLTSTHPHTLGLHESFGDLSTLFLMLSEMDVCEDVIVQSKGDLHNRTYFSQVGEQFGKALGRQFSLRNADNDHALSDVDPAAHSISNVFTGAIYDILVDYFNLRKDTQRYTLAQTLFEMGARVQSLVTLAILYGPKTNATFSDIAEKMIEMEPYNDFKAIIQSQFSIRGILGTPMLSNLTTMAPLTLAFDTQPTSSLQEARQDEVDPNDEPTPTLQIS